MWLSQVWWSICSGVLLPPTPASANGGQRGAQKSEGQSQTPNKKRGKGVGLEQVKWTHTHMQNTHTHTHTHTHTPSFHRATACARGSSTADPSSQWQSCLGSGSPSGTPWDPWRPLPSCACPSSPASECPLRRVGMGEGREWEQRRGWEERSMIKRERGEVRDKLN